VSTMSCSRPQSESDTSTACGRSPRPLPLTSASPTPRRSAEQLNRSLPILGRTDADFPHLPSRTNERRMRLPLLLWNVYKQRTYLRCSFLLLPLRSSPSLSSQTPGMPPTPRYFSVNRRNNRISLAEITPDELWDWHCRENLPKPPPLTFFASRVFDRRFDPK
jgi:hypothetical protein